MDFNSLSFYIKLSLISFLFINKMYAISENTNEIYSYKSTMKDVNRNYEKLFPEMAPH